MPKSICTAVSLTIPWNLNQVSSHLYPVSETRFLFPRGLSSHSKVTYTGTTLLQRSQGQNSRHRNREVNYLQQLSARWALAAAHSPAELCDCKWQFTGWAVKTARLARPYIQNSLGSAAPISAASGQSNMPCIILCMSIWPELQRVERSDPVHFGSWEDFDQVLKDPFTG